MQIKIGQMYHIVFDDHCTNSDEPMVCEAFRKVLDIGEKHIKLATWIVRSDDKGIFKDNLECFILLKSCIREWSLLCQKRTWKAKR